MIFDLAENDFIRQTGTVYFLEDEEKFTIYKVSDNMTIIFRLTYVKSTPEETIMFMERSLINATRLQAVEKDVTFNVSMS
jgi:hypothetical protein